MAAWSALSGPRVGALFVCALGLLWLPQAGAAPARHAVSSGHPLATEAGHKTLARGGNAFDAAVTVSAVLAVVEPHGSGLGGGGFWLLQPGDGEAVMVDGRERAPLAASRTMYQDDEGRVMDELAIDGPLAAGIPGEPAALAHIAERYGDLPLARSLAPAIRLAREGFPVDEGFRRMARFRLETLRASPAAASTFLADGKVPEEGAVLRQPELARTLERLAEAGRAGFYAGELAKRLVEGVREAGGVWSLQDLRRYQVVEREPTRGEYRDMSVTAASPPSSGGPILVEMLNILAGYDLASLPSAARKHLIVEAMRRAYRDRAEHLGDPDYVAMPLERLTHPYYAAGLRASIRLDRATPSTALAAVTGAGPRGRDTTHLSILDAEGNRVAATLSVNYPFGSGFMPPGTGVVLNDEMGDFSAKPGEPDVYGLVASQANAIEPGKRMLSSMTPTFLDTGERLAVLGTPGGGRIITMVLLAALEFAEGGTARSMVGLPRFHHQYLPDEIELEPEALSAEERAALKDRGHELSPMDRRYGDMQVVVWDRARGEVTAASDPRGIGSARVALPVGAEPPSAIMRLPGHGVTAGSADRNRWPAGR